MEPGNLIRCANPKSANPGAQPPAAHPVGGNSKISWSNARRDSRVPLRIGSEEAPTEGLASVRRSNRTCRFPASGFRAVRRNIPNRAQRRSVSLATANRRGFVNLVSSVRARGVFHKRNWSISPDFTHHVARPLCSHNLRCLPPGPPGPVWDSGVLLHRSMVICSTLTSRRASVATSGLPYKLPYRPRTGTNASRSPGVTRKSSVPCRPHTPWCARGDATRLRLHSAGSTAP